MRRALVLLVPAMLLAACTPSPASDMPEDIAARLAQVDQAVADWADAATPAEAHAAAEAARNLVLGPDAPFYGDADGDGETLGAVAVGLLPGRDGQPGLVRDPAVNACVERDVLGGSWERPSERWDQAVAAIEEWRADLNTFPGLSSHPQRLIGWATLALESSDLDTIHEFASHARLHLEVARAAYDDCTTGI
ncbi:hypothetical protein [Demequina soli]|uniref:hypothetical protein n=1 Tax=Demequina soli TaxID=1638987 RepID=UPI00078029E6|nr:hypothetical protein [Demequina soli]